MFVDLILIGGILFWILVAVLSAIVVGCIHSRGEGFGFFSIGCFFLLCLFAGNLWPFTKAHWDMILVCLACYPLVGIAWSVPRWILFLDSIRNEYKRQLAQFTKSIGPVSEHAKAWASRVGNNPFYDAGLTFDIATQKLSPPQFCNNKERIAGWVMLWPWSIIDTLLGDVLARIGDWIVSAFRRSFQAISNWMFSDL